MWNSEQPDQALKEKCGEMMKSDNKWDLGTEGGQQRLLIPTEGRVTRAAAYAEQAHKVTLNASSDIFARCSKTASNIRFAAFGRRHLQRPVKDPG